MLRIEIIDDDCGEDEAHVHRVSLETDKAEIMAAIAVFYPGATSIRIEVVAEEE